MTNLWTWSAWALLAAALTGCGYGHIASEYEPYRATRDDCSDTAVHAMTVARQPTIAMSMFAPPDRVQFRSLRNHTKAVEFEILIEGMPHCTRTVLGIAGSDLYSQMPELPPVADSSGWIDAGDTVHLVSSVSGQEFRPTAQPQACLFDTGVALVPAWKLEGTWNGEPVRLFANGEDAFRKDRLGFNLSGTATIYKSHPGSGLIDVSLPDLDGSGALRSLRFVTDVPPDIPRAQADGPDFRFSYDPSDRRFQEVSVFANAERMASFLTHDKFDYRMDCLPIHLRVPDRMHVGNGLWRPINNATYIPPSFNTDGPFPMVLIGEGDGIGLRNIPVDADVIFHEISHHAIYRTLQSTTYESRVIHEALADYLTFAKTNNACIGESLCPPGTKDCWQAGCLRTGENRLKLTDEDLPTSHHRRSQVFSGMLWDMRKTLGREVVDRVAFHAIDYLLWESRYEDLVFALMAADRDLYQGAHACRLFAIAHGRGLGGRLKKLSCDDFVPAPKD